MFTKEMESSEMSNMSRVSPIVFKRSTVCSVENEEEKNGSNEHEYN